SRASGVTEGSSRRPAMLLPLVLTFAVSACTGASTFQGTPRDLVLQAARECEVETPGVRVSGTDRYGRVEFSYRTPGDHDRFVSCFQQRARERVAGAMASLAAGQPVASADGLRQASIPITVTGNLVRVDVIANGSVPLTLLLDTGASRTVLRPAAATRLGADPLPNAPRWPTTLADGRVIVVPYTR